MDGKRVHDTLGSSLSVAWKAFQGPVDLRPHTFWYWEATVTIFLMVDFLNQFTHCNCAGTTFYPQTLEMSTWLIEYWLQRSFLNVPYQIERRRDSLWNFKLDSLGLVPQIPTILRAAFNAYLHIWKSVLAPDHRGTVSSWRLPSRLIICCRLWRELRWWHDATQRHPCRCCG